MQESIKKISEIIWNNFKYKNALFSVSSLWLGHATRTLAIIKYYLDLGFSITIISYWNALNFLKQELVDSKNIDFIELQDYPALERWVWLKFYYYLIIDILRVKSLIKKENKFVNSLWNNFDFIFSDGRYWVYSKGIKSYLLSHQISFELPKKLSIFKKISDLGNYNYFKNFNSILIPDFEDEKFSLAWKLSHNHILEKLNYNYVWPISSYLDLKNKQKNIDYYFIISWYLEEHKENFVNKLIEQAKYLEWIKVFVLGDTFSDYVKHIKEYDITIYSSVSSTQRLDLFSRANVIISRAWYTTVMDLILNDKKAILFPTKNQTEQEYLATYLDDKWLFVNWWEDNFNLKDLISKLK